MIAVPPTRRRSRAALGSGLVAVFTASVLAGCGLFGSDAAPSTSTSTTEASTTSTTAPLPPAAPPTVLDPGAEPRQQLRLQFTEGQQTTVTLTSDFQIDQTADGRPQRIDAPPVTQELTYEVGEVTDAGAQVTATVTRITVDSEGTGLSAEDGNELEAQLAPMIGLTGTGTITPYGAFDDLSFEVPAEVNDQVTGQIRQLESQAAQLGPTLPVEAVGVGARWEFESTQRSGGLDFPIVTIVTVDEVTATSISYRTTISGTVEEEPLSLDGLPDGTTATLESSEITGSGTGTLALDRPAYTWRTRASGQQTLRLTSDDGGEGDVTVEQQIEVASAARAAAD